MYHEPVLLHASVHGLNIRPGGTYVDATFGGGGHAAAILEQLDGGKLVAFDQDADAKPNAQALVATGKDFTLVEDNFRHLRQQLTQRGVTGLDGLLADLGVSSHQFDAAERGFSTRFAADLDMRMNARAGQSARQVLNTYSEAALHRLLGMYGEVTNARTLAAALVQARTNGPLQTVDELKQVLQRLAPRGKEHKYFAQVFQALRIEVNDELKALEELLTQATQLLRPGGRLVVLAYHSLEDRLVKNWVARGKFTGEVDKDFFGNPQRPLRSITRKPVEASDEEVARNPRARSAKLRIAEKITD